jgi:cysteine desulfuration protein SufE
MDNSLESLDELVENFSLFDDWEERYKYLIDLGKRLPLFPDSEKLDEYLVQGCTSRVWLIPDKSDSSEGFHFKADSDALIVKGLIYVLMSAFYGQSYEHIQACDIEASFKEMGLTEHLSPNRRNGFFSMVGRVKSLTAKS